jgi:hypothetical protein
MLRAARETETTQEDMQYWLQLDEEDPGFQILTEGETSAVIYICLYSYSSALLILLHSPFLCFLSFFFGLLWLSFAPFNRIIV